MIIVGLTPVFIGKKSIILKLIDLTTIIHTYIYIIKIGTACEINACLNNGFCSSNGTCLCSNGFYDDQCQTCNRYKFNLNTYLYIWNNNNLYIQIDNNCYINNCLNQGICIDNITYFTCNCSNGYSGTLCQNCLFYSYYFHYYLKF